MSNKPSNKNYFLNPVWLQDKKIVSIKTKYECLSELRDLFQTLKVGSFCGSRIKNKKLVRRNVIYLTTGVKRPYLIEYVQTQARERFTKSQKPKELKSIWERTTYNRPKKLQDVSHKRRTDFVKHKSGHGLLLEFMNKKIRRLDRENVRTLVIAQYCINREGILTPFRVSQTKRRQIRTDCFCKQNWKPVWMTERIWQLRFFGDSFGFRRP